ncbi:Pseudouridine synthase, partial [human gut metagenome]
KKVDEKDIQAFKSGITLDDGYKCMEAKLEIISASEEGSEIRVTYKRSITVSSLLSWVADITPAGLFIIKYMYFL